MSRAYPHYENCRKGAVTIVLKLQTDYVNCLKTNVKVTIVVVWGAPLLPTPMIDWLGSPLKVEVRVRVMVNWVSVARENISSQLVLTDGTCLPGNSR